MTRVPRSSRLLVVVVLLAAIVLPSAPAASAEALPAPGADYESEALALCPAGEIDCVIDTLDALRSHTRTLAKTCDHDAIFAALYTVVTETFLRTVSENPAFFEDPAFVRRQDQVFAYYYLWPYANWSNDAPGAVPPAWRVAFEAAEGEDVSAGGNLLLGINAHVVRDLPFALAGLGLGQKRDHDKVNDILWRAYGPAIDTIAAHLDDSVDDTDADGTSLDNESLFRLVTSWRESAWHDATLLADAFTPLDHAIVAAQIEEKAHAQALSLRAATTYPPGTTGPSQRNQYCTEHAWPPEWLGGM